MLQVKLQLEALNVYPAAHVWQLVPEVHELQFAMQLWQVLRELATVQ
jgi:hypothetical protein